MAILDFSGHPITPADDTKKTVPTDVFAYIIAFLDVFWNRPAIVNSTLVCRAWFACGRAKLFHSIRFETQQGWTLFESFLAPAAPSHITQYLKSVRELVIDLDGHDQRWSWTHEVLADCSEHLTGLKLIGLYSIPWGWEWGRSLLSIPNRPYASVERLLISHIEILDSLDLYRLISAVPNVSRIDISHIVFQQEVQGMDFRRLQDLEQLPKLHPLKELRIESSAMAVVRWIAKSGLMNRLNRFSFDWDAIREEEFWTEVSEIIDSSTLSSLGCEFELAECRESCAYLDRIIDHNVTDCC